MQKSTSSKAPKIMKKVYVPPKVVGYGTVAKLTQGTGTMGADGGGTMTMN